MDLNMEDILEKLNSREYKYYYDDKKHDSSKGLNCYDEICPGSHERGNEFRQLMQEKVLVGSDDFMGQFGGIIYRMHDILQEELMTLLNFSEREANLWIDAHVDFNHVKETVDEKGNKYLSVDPIIGPNKYGGNDDS